MDISVKGKHLDVGDAMRGYAEDQLNAAVSKYFDRALDATVILSKEGRMFRAKISVHAGRGMVMQGGGQADDLYPAFDSALEHITKRLRRYKRRLRDHHKGRGASESLPAQYSIIAAEEEEPVAGDQPTIIAEMSHEIATLTVGEAVMRLDLSENPVMMFRNGATGGLNVVYRRADGNIGWIDPVNTKQS
jgi:ribosomal subunit interface protein